MMQSLNLTEFPLDSLSLIEASAGTGKTYALANLYLRYLLERGFSVEQILVVTFTEAATQELKDRIRLRIQELRQVFEGASTQDPVLLYLFERSASPEKDQLLLRLAERQIDQAQIHTIHGFCQQVLKRHALDANVPLQQSLLEDQTQLRKAALEDFWRRYVLLLERNALHFVISKWREPSDLMKALAPLLNRSPEAIIPAPGKLGLDDWCQAFHVQQRWFEILKGRTLEMIDEVDALLTEQPLKRPADKLKWLGQMRAWAEKDGLDFELPKTGKDSLFSRFTQSRITTETPAKKPVPQHAYFEFLETHLQEMLPDLCPLFLAQSFPLVKQLIEDAKQQQNAFGFDDLIKRVASSLKQADQSLSANIAAPYEVALIDEFQDTDPDQYFIFNSLFGTASTKALPRLVLIGDPKQAIYGFRGGDIQTYLLAKRTVSRHTNGRVFTMDTNWRSSPQMVQAVNAVFGLADDAFMAEDIPFQPVNAAKKSLPGLPPYALIISQFETEQGSKKEEIQFTLAQYCVQQIVALLAQSAELKLEDDRPLQHSDIAILVRSGREGETMKQMLAKQGLIATLDSQSSVYHSVEAKALYFLLAAAADPNDEQALRRCLSEPFFGLSDPQILAFNEQAHVFATYMQQFEYLHQKWQQAGVLAMIREALKCLGVFDYWHQQLESSDPLRDQTKAARFWERSLTNWNQLAEILQKQSRLQKGHFALLRWYQDTLAAALSDTGLGDDQSKLRLESDAQLIRIVTIHKSKGLEYPFVFIPFLISSRGAGEAWFYDEQGKLTLDLTNAQSSQVAAEQERLAEDIRLLYVALTRAKYQCYVGTAAYKGQGVQSQGFHKTALGYLLFNGQLADKTDDEQLHQQLTALQTAFPDLIKLEIAAPQHELNESNSAHASVHKANVHKTNGHKANADAPELLSARHLSRSIYDDWRVQSFTGLMHENQQHGRLPQTPAAPTIQPAISIFNFPRGSQAGTFLHTLFEHLVFEEGELQAELRSTYPDMKRFIETKLKLARLVEDALIPAWAEYLTQWVAEVLSVPLQADIRLADLKTGQYFAEMQFYFSVKQMQSQRFNALLKRYLKTEAELEFASFEGHLKGAIDLVFEAQGRFYILDYKSNYLGDTKADYQFDALQVAMEAHRYDVQYLIYCLALHRFLKQRLKDRYDYARDFGGVIYLFLRGLNLNAQDAIKQSGPGYTKEGQTETGIYFVRPPVELISKLDEEVGY